MARSIDRLAVVLLPILAVACAGVRATPECSAAPAAPAQAGEILASGAGFTISSEDYRARFAELKPDARAAFATPEKRRQLLENLIRFELLAAEGQRLGLDRDPEVVLTMKKVIVQRLVKDRFSREGDRSEKEKAFDALVESLRARANVQVNAAPLDSMVLDAGGAGPAPAKR